jgi:hypothetical protein
MKMLATIGVASLLAIAAASPAAARQGCGRGFHRAPNGMCRPNMRQQMWVVGRYYPGRGYWDGRRWWRHRYRYRNGWRYRG